MRSPRAPLLPYSHRGRPSDPPPGAQVWGTATPVASGAMTASPASSAAPSTHVGRRAGPGRPVSSTASRSCSTATTAPRATRSGWPWVAVRRATSRCVSWRECATARRGDRGRGDRRVRPADPRRRGRAGRRAGAVPPAEERDLRVPAGPRADRSPAGRLARGLVAGRPRRAAPARPDRAGRAPWPTWVGPSARPPLWEPVSADLPAGAATHTWPDVLTSLLAGAGPRRRRPGLGDGPDHGRRGQPGAGRRVPHGAAGQGRDGRGDARPGRHDAGPRQPDRGGRAEPGHRRHRRRPGAHRQHLDDGGDRGRRRPACGWSSTATGRRPPPRGRRTCSRRSGST